MEEPKLSSVRNGSPLGEMVGGKNGGNNKCRGVKAEQVSVFPVVLYACCAGVHGFFFTLPSPGLIVSL